MATPVLGVELGSHRQTPTTAAPEDAIGAATVSHSQVQHEFSLPHTDGGKKAWSFLAACWAVEALVWGRFPPFIFRAVLDSWHGSANRVFGSRFWLLIWRLSGPLLLSPALRGL